MSRFLLRWSVGLIAVGAVGCAGGKSSTKSPLLNAALNRPVSEIASMDLQFLRADPARPLYEELWALHSLYDLLDQARFGQDDAARDQLWKVLAAGETRRGAAAFRQAASGILSRAWDLEAAAEKPDAKNWNLIYAQSLAQLIMLLSMDVSPSVEPDQVQSLALGLRTLQENAYPEIADNLAWRVYDFDRALMDSIVNAPPRQRPALLRLGTLLLEDPESASSPHPSTHTRWIAPWRESRRQLSEDPRWSATQDQRRASDEELYERLVLACPTPRSADWNLATLEPEGLSPDPLESVIVVRDGGMQIDGRALIGSAPDKLGAAMAQHLAVVGRSVATVAVDRMTPAPKAHEALAAVANADLEHVLLAGYPQDVELPPAAFHAPLVGIEVSFQDALIPARLYIAQFDTGYRIGWNQALLPDLLSDLDAVAMWVSRYQFAYPHRDAVQIAFARDIAYEQRLALLARLRRELGPSATLDIVQTREATPRLWPDSPALTKDLQTRARWQWPRGTETPPPTIETQSGQEPSTQEVALVHRLVSSMQRCLSELGRTQLKARALSAQFHFSEGALAKWEWAGIAKNRIGPQATARVNTCVQDYASRFVLPSAKLPWTIQVTWQLPKSASGR